MLKNHTITVFVHTEDGMTGLTFTAPSYFSQDGLLATHRQRVGEKEGHWWDITHIPTKFSLTGSSGKLLTQREAIALVKRLAGAEWDFTDASNIPEAARRKFEQVTGRET